MDYSQQIINTNILNIIFILPQVDQVIAFGGINFAALNKSDGTRKKYISRYGDNGCMIEMDYDAYHLRLIAEIVGYEFPEGSVHQYLADQYGVDYDKSKSLSFKYLYGEIPYMNI